MDSRAQLCASVDESGEVVASVEQAGQKQGRQEPESGSGSEYARRGYRGLGRVLPRPETRARALAGRPARYAPGQHIDEFLTRFLLHLLDEGLATKTLHRHRDHRWMLGGELIRRRYDDAKVKKLPIGKVIAELIEEEGVR